MILASSLCSFPIVHHQVKVLITGHQKLPFTPRIHSFTILLNLSMKNTDKKRRNSVRCQEEQSAWLRVRSRAFGAKIHHHYYYCKNVWSISSPSHKSKQSSTVHVWEGAVATTKWKITNNNSTNNNDNHNNNYKRNKNISNRQKHNSVTVTTPEKFFVYFFFDSLNELNITF